MVWVEDCKQDPNCETEGVSACRHCRMCSGMSCTVNGRPLYIVEPRRRARRQARLKALLTMICLFLEVIRPKSPVAHTPLCFATDAPAACCKAGVATASVMAQTPPSCPAQLKKAKTQKTNRQSIAQSGLGTGTSSILMLRAVSLL